MPDLKSELQKLEGLKFDDEGETQQEVTMQESQNDTGVSATFFNVIRDNPGCSRKHLISLGEKRGVVKASSSSLLAQFVTRGLVRSSDVDGTLVYFATAKDYVRGYVRKPKKAAKVQPLAAAPKKETGVSELLNNMSIVKARALYDELKKIFGG